MAQFDSLIIFTLLWSLILTLVLYYSMSVKALIPNFFGTKKFREKKLESFQLFKFFKENFEVRSEKSYSDVSSNF